MRCEIIAIPLVICIFARYKSDLRVINSIIIRSQELEDADSIRSLFVRISIELINRNIDC
jgi:hypothetical protein